MKKNIIFKTKMNRFLLLLLSSFIIHYSSFAQTATCSTPGIIAKWNFDTETVQCNGGIDRPFTGYTNPTLSMGITTHCPQINAGCGTGLLGSKGHQNTPNYQNALCLFNFYDSNNPKLAGIGAPFDPNSTVWNPLALVNVYAEYTLPAGKIGCFTSFAVKVLQKQFDGTQAGVNFEKQGIAVYRNGIQVYSQTQNILAANVNGTPISATFTGTDFCSDGSESVTFRVYFGLVHQLIDPSLPAIVKQTGYDDICMNGTCGGPNGSGIASSPTCTAGVANANGSIKMSGYGATDKYDYNLGTTYTGGKTYATATAVPAGGVIVNNLANPAGSSATYTVRLFDAAGCFSDIRVVLKQIVCPPFCNPPTGTVATVTEPTCVGTTPQNNGSIAITGVTGGDKVAISIGGVYTAATTYATATALAGGAYTFTGLANPIGGSQLYTIRIWNAVQACYIDKIVELTGDDCAVCKKGKSEVWSSSLGDPDSTPANDVTAEDDQAIAEFCLGTQKVDLALTKTVSPATGTVCGASGVGTTFTWTVTLNNTGDLATTDIQIADILPAGLNLVSSTTTLGNFYGNVGWVIPTIAAGASATLTITTTALKAGTFKNVVEVVDYFPINDPDSSPNNQVTTEDDYAEATITVTGNSPPTISKEFSPMLTKPNTPTRLTFKIINNEATPITLTEDFVDVFPTSPAAMVIAATPNLQNAGLTIPTVGITATAGGTSIIIPKGTTLSPGLNQISVEITVPSDGNYCNDIAAGAMKTSNGENCLAAQACILANNNFVMAPMLKKTMLPANIQTGQNATLTLSIENRNAVTMNLDQDFVDYLPMGLVLAGTPTSSCASLTVTAENSNKELKIASGGTIPANTTCTITVPVTAAAAGNYCNVIVMNGFLTTVGAINNVGNEDIAEACITVTATPCTALSAAAITPPTANVVPDGTINFSASVTGTSVSTLYNWSGTGSFSSQTASTTWTAPSTAGIYQVTVTLNNQLTGYGTCITTAVADITVAAPCSLSASATKTDVKCNGGTDGAADLTVTGSVATPTYAWSNGATTEDLTNVAAGNYTVTVTNGACTATATIAVTEPIALVYVVNSSTNVTCFGAANGSLSFTASGGIAPYTYSINNGVSYPNATGIFSGLSAAQYKLAAKDANGCVVKCP